MPMLTTRDISGSWFPSGYYGHFLGNPRGDFVNEFRYLAKPLPPRKFVQRSQERPQKHIFSHHDNREKFMNDAMYFEQGLGRRRAQKPTFASNEGIMTWRTPEDDPTSVSMYQQCYSPTRKQMLTRRPKTTTGVADQFMSSYRYYHGESNPNKESLATMANELIENTRLPKSKALAQRIERSKSAGRQSVAECMYWPVISQECPPLDYERSVPPYLHDYSTVREWRNLNPEAKYTLGKLAIPIETVAPLGTTPAETKAPSTIGPSLPVATSTPTHEAATLVAEQKAVSKVETPQFSNHIAPTRTMQPSAFIPVHDVKTAYRANGYGGPPIKYAPVQKLHVNQNDNDITAVQRPPCPVYEGSSMGSSETSQVKVPAQGNPPQPNAFVPVPPQTLKPTAVCT